MIDVLRIAHLRIAPQEGNSEVGNCEVHHPASPWQGDPSCDCENANLSLYLQLSRFVNPPFKKNVGRRSISFQNILYFSQLYFQFLTLPHEQLF